MANNPRAEFRLGSIRCVIWENQSKGNSKGGGQQTWFNCELTRRFKQGDEWKDSSSFSGLSELAQVKLAVELAIEWLSRRELEQETE